MAMNTTATLGFAGLTVIVGATIQHVISPSDGELASAVAASVDVDRGPLAEPPEPPTITDELVGVARDHAVRELSSRAGGLVANQLGGPVGQMLGAGVSRAFGALGAGGGGGGLLGSVAFGMAETVALDQLEQSAIGRQLAFGYRAFTTVRGMIDLATTCTRSLIQCGSGLPVVVSSIGGLARDFTHAFPPPPPPPTFAFADGIRLTPFTAADLDPELVALLDAIDQPTLGTGAVLCASAGAPCAGPGLQLGTIGLDGVELAWLPGLSPGVADRLDRWRQACLPPGGQCQAASVALVEELASLSKEQLAQTLAVLGQHIEDAPPLVRALLERSAPALYYLLGTDTGRDILTGFANAGIDDLTGLVTLAIDPVGQLTAMGEGLASLIQWAASDPGGAAQTLLHQVMTACSESPGGCVGTGAYWVATTIGSGGITTLGSASKLGKLLASLDDVGRARLLRRVLHRNETLASAAAMCARGYCGDLRETATRIVRDPPRVREITTLTSGTNPFRPGDAVTLYNPGSAFSGAYNPATGEWVALASEGATLVDGSAIATVDRYGGHAAAEADLMGRLPGGSSDRQNVGFVLFWKGAGELEIRWNSGTINMRNFRDRAAPAQYRDQIKRAIEAATGLRVVE